MAHSRGCGLSYLLIYPGLLRKIFPAWLSFFRPGFHPWQHDDRDLVAVHEAQLGLVAGSVQR